MFILLPRFLEKMRCTLSRSTRSPPEACMFKSLMTSRKFAPLFWCQLCSALNDNFLKNALAMLILSALGGELADRYDKAFVAQRIRLCEIPIAALAATGFFLHSVPILFVALGLFGVVAALFGPVKYGILPEKLET